MRFVLWLILFLSGVLLMSRLLATFVNLVPSVDYPGRWLGIGLAPVAGLLGLLLNWTVNKLVGCNDY